MSGELEERILCHVIGYGLEKKISYPSDFRHERPTVEQFLADIPHFHEREDLSCVVKKLVLRDNYGGFYSIDSVK